MRSICLVGFFLVGCAAPMSIMSPPSIVNSLGESVIKFELKNPSVIGTTSAGQVIKMGGFSGLRYLGRTAEGKYRFLTHTDRGPNPEPFERKGATMRPFLLPRYQPRIIYLEADPNTKTMEVVKEIPLTNAEGKPISGIPQNKNQETPVDLHGAALSFDSKGVDLEGIALDEDGSFWMVDEYGPSVLHFSEQGHLLDLLKPERGLPKVLLNKKLNRGFEGVTRDENSLYAMMQSPLQNPPDNKKSTLVRLIEVDLKTLSTVAQYAYILESKKSDKIGDIAFVSKKKILVIEQDGKTGVDSFKKVFMMNLQNATNLQLLPERVVGINGSLESTESKDLEKSKILPIEKTLIMDLAKMGVLDEKVEGIDLVDSKFLAVVVDNDFGIGGDLDTTSGKVHESGLGSYLYLIPLASELE